MTHLRVGNKHVIVRGKSKPIFFDVPRPVAGMTMPKMPWTPSATDRATDAAARGLARWSMPRLSMPSVPSVSLPSMPKMAIAGLTVRGMRKRRTSMMSRWPLLLAGMCMGGAVMYFCDPQQGNRRRKMAMDRGMAFMRRCFRAMDRRRHKMMADMAGKRQAMMHSEALEQARRKVEDVRAQAPLTSGLS